jgi:hypothetical protein
MYHFGGFLRLVLKCYYIFILEKSSDFTLLSSDMGNLVCTSLLNFLHSCLVLLFLFFQATTNITTHILQGLKPGTQYTISVQSYLSDSGLTSPPKTMVSTTLPVSKLMFQWQFLYTDMRRCCLFCFFIAHSFSCISVDLLVFVWKLGVIAVI